MVIGVTGHSFELDGPEGSAVGGHTIRNGSIKASYNGRVSEDLINVDDNSDVDLSNLYFTDIVDGNKINRVTAAAVTFTGITFNVPADSLANYVNGAVPAGVATGTTPQANITGLGWTWASQAGALSGL